MSRNKQGLTVVRQFQSEIAAIREEDEPFAARMTLHTLTAFLVVTAMLLGFTRVDRTVSSSSGRIVATEAPSVFQALDAAIIKSIDVKEGQRVEKGQLLATLDGTFAAADVQQLKDQIDGLDAEIARDEAELASSEPTFAPSDDPNILGHRALQRQLFEQRTAQYAAQVDSFDQKIAQTQATIEKFQVEEDHYKEREAIAKQIEEMRSTLLQKGAGSLLNLLTSTDSRVEALRTLDYGHNSLIEARHLLSSLTADREAFRRQWMATASQQLVTSRATRDAARSQLEKAERHKDLVKFAAAEDAIVLTVAKLNVGSVLREGDPLMTLVPTRTPLEAEVEVSTRDVGFLRPGDKATLKIDAFNFVEHGTVQATVRWISEGAFQSGDNGAPSAPYYKARLAIDAVELKDVPASFRLIPGMTLTGEIKVGTRAVGAYILSGMIQGVGDAMREP